MAKVNVPLIRFNQGLISPESLARVDDERTTLSAEVYENWIPKTQGSMRLRPGTIYQGNTLGDTGAYLIEFVAASDEVALLELTPNKMRIWSGQDGHELELLSRPKVDTTLSISDTGWYKDHAGGGVTINSTQSESIGHIPLMTDYTTEGVTMSASSEDLNYPNGGFAWKAADGFYSPWAADTGAGDTGEQWVKVDFGAGVTKQVLRLLLYAPTTNNDRMAKDFTLQYSTDDTVWNTWAMAQTGQTFASGETKQYVDTGFSDTGSPAARYWRLHVTANGSASPAANRALVGEMRLVDSANAAGVDTGQSSISAAGLRLNAAARGSVARYRKALVIDTGDIGLEHSISTRIANGPVSLRVGSTEGDDDIISQSVLRTGYHNLSFFPSVSPVHITLQSGDTVNRLVSTFNIGDSGTVELTTPWAADNLDNVRHDQSADVVFVNCKDVKQQIIERRGSDTGVLKGRSWSVVEYDSDFGPFTLPFNQDSKLRTNSIYSGNVNIKADIATFKPDQVGQLLRLTHSGQTNRALLGTENSFSTATSVVGIQDTGKNDPDSDRLIQFDIFGDYTGQFTIERSFESSSFGFKATPTDFITTGSTAGVDTVDTGTKTVIIRDPADNEVVYYRVRRTDVAGSGTMRVLCTNPSGISSGIYRITNFNTNLSVDAEVIRPCSDTGSTPDWEVGEWSDESGWPTAVAIHEGRLCHAGQASIYFSVSDDYTNFDDEVGGASAPIARTLGSGPVADILHITSSDILVAGTADSELSIRSSSFDEVITQTNTAARRISTLGATRLRAIKRNKDVFFVNRSGKNLFRLVATSRAEDSEPLDLTLLAANVLGGGVVSIAIQREPDTRIHLALADGSVAILTYEPNEELLAWSKWKTDTGTDGMVERIAVLPATGEDAVYYVIRRQINGQTKRFIEKWAKEEESIGDTGLSVLSDCSLLSTDTGRNSEVAGINHLVGCSVVAWSDDTGQANAGKDQSPISMGTQVEYTVDTGGSIVLNEDVHHAVVGLPYQATWKSTKLAYGAKIGTALTQIKRIDEIGMILYQTHNRGIEHGRDTGDLDLLPLYIDEGAQVDPDKIYSETEIRHVPFPGIWDSDSRVVLRAQSPRPVTVLAAVPHLKTSEH